MYYTDMLVYYRLTNHQKTTLIQKKPKFILTSGHRSIFQTEAGTGQTITVLLQLKKQRFGGEMASGILQRGRDFRQLLEMAPGQQGDLSFTG